jgi:hypothetical protein
MNKERLLALAKDLREGTLPTYAGHCTHFNMRKFFEVPIRWDPETKGHTYHLCGTFACIAGMAVLKWSDDFPQDPHYAMQQSIKCRAVEILDLDSFTARELFAPRWLDTLPGEAFHEDRLLAAKVIEGLVATGAVEWGIEVEEEYEQEDDQILDDQDFDDQTLDKEPNQ